MNPEILVGPQVMKDTVHRHVGLANQEDPPGIPRGSQKPLEEGLGFRV